MEIVLALVVGLIVGFFLAVALQREVDKDVIKAGIWRHGGQAFKLTLISPEDLGRR